MGATTIDVAALDQVLYGASGPIMGAVRAEAETLKEVAKSHIHRSDKEGGVHLEETGFVAETAAFGRPGFLVTFEAPYVGFLYFGTQPHRIEARNARALAFKWPKVGPGVFRFRSVRHPGTQPHPFLHEAVLEMYGVQLPPRLV